MASSCMAIQHANTNFWAHEESILQSLCGGLCECEKWSAAADIGNAVGPGRQGSIGMYALRKVATWGTSACSTRCCEYL